MSCVVTQFASFSELAPRPAAEESRLLCGFIMWKEFHFRYIIAVFLSLCIEMFAYLVAGSSFFLESPKFDKKTSWITGWWIWKENWKGNNLGEVIGLSEAFSSKSTVPKIVKLALSTQISQSILTFPFLTLPSLRKATFCMKGFIVTWSKCTYNHDELE